MLKELGLGNPAALPQDDAALLMRVRRGDESAMAVLFDRYAQVVYSVALRVLRVPVSAEEILQEIFLELWRSPEGFGEALGGALAMMARNRSVDVLRRRSSAGAANSMELVVKGNPADEATMEKARQVVAALPVEQRKTLEMTFFDGLAHTEIAEMMGEAPEAVTARLGGALTALREAFSA